MNILLQLSIVFGVCLLGEFICLYLPFSFPASVMCMIVMLVFLLLKFVKTTQIKEISEFLLGNMSFFFIPAGVSIIEHYEEVNGKIIALIAVCAISTLVTFLITAYTVIFVVKIQNKIKGVAK